MEKFRFFLPPNENKIDGNGSQHDGESDCWIIKKLIKTKNASKTTGIHDIPDHRYDKQGQTT